MANAYCLAWASTPRAQPHRPGRVVVADHHEHGVGVSRRLGGGVAPAGTGGEQGVPTLAGAVVHDDLVPGRQQPRGHTHTHAAQPDERDSGHVNLLAA